jgi:hypothetical protein
LRAKRQESGAAPAGEEAKVANADKAFGKDMQEEAAQELIERQGQEFFLIVVSTVAPAKGNLVIDEGNESVVGDGDAMGVVA